MKKVRIILYLVLPISIIVLFAANLLMGAVDIPAADVMAILFGKESDHTACGSRLSRTM